MWHRVSFTPAQRDPAGRLLDELNWSTLEGLSAIIMVCNVGDPTNADDTARVAQWLSTDQAAPLLVVLWASGVAWAGREGIDVFMCASTGSPSQSRGWDGVLQAPSRRALLRNSRSH